MIILGYRIIKTYIERMSYDQREGHGYIGLCLAQLKQTLNIKVVNKLKRKCICPKFNTKKLLVLSLQNFWLDIPVFLRQWNKKIV